MAPLFWVCIGSAAGGGARFLMVDFVNRALGAGFPWGTLAVNLLGSFAIAIVMYAGTEAQILSPTARVALGTGILGGFTTYSAFSYETMRALDAGQTISAVSNVAATVIGTLVACRLGWWCARWAFAQS